MSITKIILWPQNPPLECAANNPKSITVQNPIPFSLILTDAHKPSPGGIPELAFARIELLRLGQHTATLLLLRSVDSFITSSQFIVI